MMEDAGFVNCQYHNMTGRIVAECDEGGRADGHLVE